MLKAIQDRETGKVNLNKKLRTNLKKIDRLEDRLENVRYHLDRAEAPLLSLPNEEVDLYNDYLNDEFVNTDNIPRRVLMMADRTIPLYDEQESIIDELEELRQERRRRIPERIIRELGDQDFNARLEQDHQQYLRDDAIQRNLTRLGDETMRMLGLE